MYIVYKVIRILFAVIRTKDESPNVSGPEDKVWKIHFPGMTNWCRVRRQEYQINTLLLNTQGQ